MSNPANDREFDRNNNRYSHSQWKLGINKGSVSDPAEGCHGAADRPADPRVAAACEAAIIRECLRESPGLCRLEAMPPVRQAYPHKNLGRDSAPVSAIVGRF